jgi:hypothetical protein
MAGPGTTPESVGGEAVSRTSPCGASDPFSVMPSLLPVVTAVGTNLNPEVPIEG